MFNNFFKNLKDTFKGFDYFLASLTMLVAIVGIVMIYSATKSIGTSKVIVQSAAVAVGFVAMLIIALYDYEQIGNWSVYIYAVSVLLLILVLIPGIGTGSNEGQWGARSWIRITSSFGVQPAEFVKIAFIITFSKHVQKAKENINNFFTLLLLLAHAGLLIGLILLQPDAGSAMVFAFIALFILFVAGLSYKYIISFVVMIAVSAPLAYFFLLKPYQQDRIKVFLNPESDPLNKGYNVIQSKIAVGSGQLFGKGYMQGTQNQMGYLPTKHTDFIYGTIAEEWGFIGAVAVLLCLIIIILRVIYISRTSRTDFGSYVCAGVAGMFIFHTFENIGMCIGLMPVTGIPLPFFSYGGTAVLTYMIAIGLVISVSMRRKTLNF